MTSVRITATDGQSATVLRDTDGAIVVSLSAPAAPPTPPTPPAPPPVPPTLIGLNVKATTADYGTWFPKLPGARFSRVFSGPGKGLPSWTGQAVTGLPAGCIPHVSWKDVVSATALEAFFDGVPAAGAWVTYFHEPEPDVDPAVWRAYWRTLRSVRDNHRNRDRIRLVNIHTLWPSRHKPGVDWRAWMLPGIADVDGWDCYRDTTFDVYEPVESALALPWQAAAEFGQPWSMPELGSTLCTWDNSGAGRAKWYTDAAAYAGKRGCEAIGLWCSGNTTGTLDYRPNDRATLTAWQGLLTGQG